jgi:methyltransferase (TIGR00027 family)
LKNTRASSTSSMVALFRAAADAGISNVEGFSDPTAKLLLDGVWLKRLEQVKKRWWLRPPLKWAADLLALRTLAIDEALRKALARGAKQLVILGAGLDGRAFRMNELAKVRVLEVDHPATQALKRERAQALTATAAEVVFVPVDFERDALGSALAAAGHDVRAPTVWLSEGVVMYLSDRALRATLNVLEARSAKGSTLVVQYNTPERRSWLVATLLRLWSEPALGLRSAESMASELSAYGFSVKNDSGTVDWARTYGAPARDRQGVRIAVSVK